MNLTGYDADRFGDALREPGERAALTLPERWILSRLQCVAKEVDDALEEFRFNEAAQVIYRFVWTELCDWYIEMIKPALYHDGNDFAGQKRKRAAQGCLTLALETSCRLLHPFMPFVTDEIWQQLPKPTGTPGSIMITMYPFPDANLLDVRAEHDMETLKDVVVAVRNLRSEYNIAPGLKLDVTVQADEPSVRELLERQHELVEHLGRAGELVG